MGRTDDMLIIRGVNVFPTQIEEILIQMEETQPHYQIIVDRGQSILMRLRSGLRSRMSFSRMKQERWKAFGIGLIMR